MNLLENPIFLTHKRLVHRTGVLAPLIIAGLIGMLFLLGLAESEKFAVSNPEPHEILGKGFYGWIVGLEIVILLIGGFNRIAQTLAEDQKSGLWDSNRLTPLKPADIVAGYWLAPALREFYMAAMLAGFGLLIVLSSGLPITLWLGTQFLILTTALFCGLVALLLGMTFQRSHTGIILLVFLVFGPISLTAGPGRMMTSYLLPIYGIGQMFGAINPDSNSDWAEPGTFFGLRVPPLLITLALQSIVSLFLWRALIRKTAHPFQTLLLRWEVIAIFATLVLTQHALLWDVWSGKLATVWEAARLKQNYSDRSSFFLPYTQGLTLFIGAALLAFASPQPEQIRVDAMRLGFRNLGGVFSRSALPLALLLTGIATAGLFSQMMFSLAGSLNVFLVASVNLLEVFLTGVLLLDFCRLRHQRRAVGFLVLWLFALSIIPLLLGAIFTSRSVATFSLLAPGFIALVNQADPDWPLLHKVLAAHGVIDVLLFLCWRQQWNQLLKRAAP